MKLGASSNNMALVCGSMGFIIFILIEPSGSRGLQFGRGFKCI